MDVFDFEKINSELNKLLDTEDEEFIENNAMEEFDSPSAGNFHCNISEKFEYQSSRNYYSPESPNCAPTLDRNLACDYTRAYPLHGQYQHERELNNFYMNPSQTFVPYPEMLHPNVQYPLVNLDMSQAYFRHDLHAPQIYLHPYWNSHQFEQKSNIIFNMGNPMNLPTFPGNDYYQFNGRVSPVPASRLVNFIYPPKIGSPNNNGPPGNENDFYEDQELYGQQSYFNNCSGETSAGFPRRTKFGGNNRKLTKSPQYERDRRDLRNEIFTVESILGSRIDCLYPNEYTRIIKKCRRIFYLCSTLSNERIKVINLVSNTKITVKVSQKHSNSKKISNNIELIYRCLIIEFDMIKDFIRSYQYLCNEQTVKEMHISLLRVDQLIRQLESIKNNRIVKTVDADRNLEFLHAIRNILNEILKEIEIASLFFYILNAEAKETQELVSKQRFIGA